MNCHGVCGCRARMVVRLLCREGHEIGRRRVRTLMKCSAVLHAEHEPPQRSAQHLAVSAVWPEDCAGQPGVGSRHDIHSDGVRTRAPKGTFFALAPGRGGGLAVSYGEQEGTFVCTVPVLAAESVRVCVPRQNERALV